LSGSLLGAIPQRKIFQLDDIAMLDGGETLQVGQQEER
jgi:hypothetical protein